MKPLVAALTGAALLALAAPVSAQPYPMGQASPMSTMPMPPQAPIYETVAPSWATDDGSSSDFPVHMPGDISGERLNSLYGNGIDVPPPNGFPAPYDR